MSSFPPYDLEQHYSMKAAQLRAATAVSRAQPYYFIRETGKRGLLHYVAVNFADVDNLFLVIKLDDERIFDWSSQELSTAAAGRLALTEADCAGGMLYVGEIAANGYSIVFDVSRFPLPFAHKLEVIFRSNIDGNLNVNGAYGMYGLYGE